MWEPCGPFGIAVSRPFWRSSRTRIACSRSRLRGTAVARAASLEQRVLRALALQCGQSRGDEQREGDHGRHGVARQTEHEGVVAAAEPGRLARLQRDPPEDLFDAEARERRLDVVVGADRDAAGDDHHVGGLERGPEALLRGGGVVGEAVGRRAYAALVLGERDQHRSVGVVDLARAERLARGLELIARGQHLDPGPAGDGQLGDAGRDRRAQFGGAQHGAGFEHRGARAHVLAATAYVVAEVCRGAGGDGAVLGVDVLLGDHRGGASGNRAAGRDANRLMVVQRVGGRQPGAGLGDDGQGAPGGAGHQRVAVHRRAGKRRDVAGGVQVGGQHSI